MPTPKPTDIPQPSDPQKDDSPAVESPATLILSKDDKEKETEAAEPESKTWSPRPNTVLSPEEKDLEDLSDEELEDLASGGVSKGIFAGAMAIVTAALGLASVTGTWFGNILLAQAQLQSQVGATGKSTATQLAEGYTGPWHKVAEINGLVATIALVVGALVLFSGRYLTVRPLPNWVKTVAWGGLALGVIGLFIAFGMRFDWWTYHIVVPATTSSSTSTTG
jgi:hypothetical protein